MDDINVDFLQKQKTSAESRAKLRNTLKIIPVLSSPIPPVLGMKVKQIKSVIWLFLKINP